MFELKQDQFGNNTLFYVNRYRNPGERGMWIELCHQDDENAAYFVSANRKMGVQVEVDQHGMYRALILAE